MSHPSSDARCSRTPDRKSTSQESVSTARAKAAVLAYQMGSPMAAKSRADPIEPLTSVTGARHDLGLRSGCGDSTRLWIAKIPLQEAVSQPHAQWQQCWHTKWEIPRQQSRDQSHLSGPSHRSPELWRESVLVAHVAAACMKHAVVVVAVSVVGSGSCVCLCFVVVVSLLGVLCCVVSRVLLVVVGVVAWGWMCRGRGVY